MEEQNKYILNHEGESQRLEKQAGFQFYSLRDELSWLRLKENEMILDAGCGTGLVSRYIIDQEKKSRVEGCDFSEMRLKEARRLSSKSQKYQDINFFQSSLEKIDRGDQTYDTIISRYVFEHLHSVLEVSRELYRLTRTGGQIYIIDFDGIFINFFSANPTLNALLLELKNGLLFDLEIGRKIPSYLHLAGFKDIEWDVQVCKFQDKELENEYENTKERCIFARPMFESIFKSSIKTDHFISLYLKEMRERGSVLFHNKFIVKAKK